ncbi:MAG: hypothetical protein QXO75_05045 [Nitrososphaerota archaeon]
MRERIAENRRKGKAAEEQFKTRCFLEGKEVERTGRGHDFRVRERDWWTGKVKRSYVVEVKSGESRLSKLQKKIKKKKSNYKVVKEDPWFY